MEDLLLDFLPRFYKIDVYLFKFKLTFKMKKLSLNIISFLLSFLLLLSVSVVPISAEAEVVDMDGLNQAVDNLNDWNDDWWNDNLSEDDYVFTTMGESTGDIDDLVAMGIFITIYIIMMTPVYVYGALSLMTIAKKLNIKNPWFAWIPVFQIVLFFQCAGLSPWLTILLFIPFVNIIVGLIFMIYGWMKIAENRGFESWYGILLIVPVVGIVMPGYLAWAEPKSKTE